MYYWTIKSGANTETRKADTFAEACKKAGFDPNKSYVLKVD